MRIVIIDNYVFMFQSNDALDKIIMHRYYGCDGEEKVAMKCYYGCCYYKGRRQIQVQQLQCHQGCHKQYPVPQPHPTYIWLLTNTIHQRLPIPTMLVNKDYRQPILPVPQLLYTMDLKVVGAKMENETLVL